MVQVTISQFVRTFIFEYISQTRLRFRLGAGQHGDFLNRGVAIVWRQELQREVKYYYRSVFDFDFANIGFDDFYRRVAAVRVNV